jgi:hypothetical protein
MKFLTILIFILLFSGCSNKWDKSDHRFTINIGKNLWVEIYRVFGSGALGGDLMSEYLTDSTSFRKYIGTYDNARETYRYELSDENISVKKYNNEGEEIILLEQSILDINQLKTDHKME